VRRRIGKKARSDSRYYRQEVRINYFTQGKKIDDGGRQPWFNTVRLGVVGGRLTEGGRRVDDRREPSVWGWLEGSPTAQGVGFSILVPHPTREYNS
jgi:hypothetical protein